MVRTAKRAFIIEEIKQYRGSSLHAVSVRADSHHAFFRPSLAWVRWVLWNLLAFIKLKQYGKIQEKFETLAVDQSFQIV